MTSGALARPDVTLDDRYLAESGEVLLSGIQAIARMLMDQRRADLRNGLRTGAFISGYQGSPLGTLDMELSRARKHLEPLGVVFEPAVNEELAATAIAGTQVLGEFPGRRVDGVTGFWYGKNPGLDRAADAIRHANISGTSPLGGAVALVGDDPASKSSSLPSSCEPMCRSLVMPVLSPGTVEDILTLGLHAVRLSRHAGVWASLKIVTDVADATDTVDVGRAFASAFDIALEPRDGFEPAVMLPPMNLDAELDLLSARLDRAAEYGRLAGLNAITFEPTRPRIALAAGGLGYQAILRALDDLAIGEAEREMLGIRLVRLSMPWPLERQDAQRLFEGVETVLVVEDKLPFVEGLIRDGLYRSPQAPLVLGKEDAEGRPLLPMRGFVTADDVARALARVVGAEAMPAEGRRRLEALDAPDRTRAAELPTRRTPYFCSGCPHNTSTRAAPDQLIGVGIGCHTMVMIDGGDRRGRTTGLTQMGGEGAQWIGIAPFTDDPHFIQNLGDGTFHHSGSLAIRASVAASVNITYKLLYNDAVAMTGGQRPQGKLDVPELTRWLAAEGVARVVVTTPEPERYRNAKLDSVAEVRHRDELQQAQRELAEVPGVTVLVHDDQCAAEKRRKRKRGLLETPAHRIAINERVCEGCGDCGEQSTCLSLLPVSTEFGRKTQVQQSSCNLDTSCLKGDCPSFLMVFPKPGSDRKRSVPEPPAGLPEPAMRVPEDVLIRMPGVGGTGVVTVSAILQMAAHLDGRYAGGLEQIGLAQKGGPVISDVRVASSPLQGQFRAGTFSADVILGLDLVGAASQDTLSVADPDRTVAVLNTNVTPTAAMVTDVKVAPAPTAVMADRVDAVTRAEENLRLDATGMAERLFDDHMPSNMIIFGAAFQHGCIPVSEAAIEQAIRLNGAAVEANLAAFGWGRAAVAAPAAVEKILAPEVAEAEPDAGALERVARSPLPGTLQRVAAIRYAELLRYQSKSYAEDYLAELQRVSAIERDRTPGTSVTEEYARGLFKLMAYKDEYEVARLHLDARERQRVVDEFGEKADVRVMLHPPILRAMGLKRKLRLGRSAFGTFRVLCGMRRLRGTKLDPFGYAEVRRVERAIIPEYRAIVDDALEDLRPETTDQVRAIAALPDVVRGYEGIKLANVAEFRRRAEQSLKELSTLGENAHSDLEEGMGNEKARYG